MHAPPKPDYPIIKSTDLVEHDGILVGLSTRYGGIPAQMKVRSLVPVARSLGSAYADRFDRHSGTLLAICGLLEVWQESSGELSLARRLSRGFTTLRAQLTVCSLLQRERRRPGGCILQHAVHFYAPRNALRSPWLQGHLPVNLKPR